MSGKFNQDHTTELTAEFLVQQFDYTEVVTYVVLEGDELLNDHIRNDGHSYRGLAGAPIVGKGESKREFYLRCAAIAQKLEDAR